MDNQIYYHPYIVAAIHWIVSAIALKITASLVKNFEIEGFIPAVIAALFIGFANAFVRPILLFLTFPLTILTLGLFIFVVNAMILKICAAILPKFRIKGWSAAIFGAFVLAVISTILHWVIA